MSNQFTTVSEIEARKRKFQPVDDATRYAPLTKRAIAYGAIAGILMSLFISVSGFYITGDSAGFGFLKYLILGAAIAVLMVKTKAETAPRLFFKNAFVTGVIASAVSAGICALATLFFNTRSILIDPVSEAGEVVLNRGVLAGVTLFETFVAGMIFLLICLQFLKTGKRIR